MIEIKEIIFSPTLKIYKSRFNIENIDPIIELCEKVVKQKREENKNTTDGFTYFIGEVKTDTYSNLPENNGIDVIKNFGLNSCIDLHKKPINRIDTDMWINVVRAKNPVQVNYKNNGKLIFHNHVELNRINKKPIPDYTFVCYLQMPDNLKNDDGVLFIQDMDGKVYSILPEVGDCIMMDGHLPHVPNYAPDSTKDRIVLAGNVKLEYAKTTKSLL